MQPDCDLCILFSHVVRCVYLKPLPRRNITVQSCEDRKTLTIPPFPLSSLIVIGKRNKTQHSSIQFIRYLLRFLISKFCIDQIVKFNVEAYADNLE